MGFWNWQATRTTSRVIEPVRERQCLWLRLAVGPLASADLVKHNTWNPMVKVEKEDEGFIPTNDLGPQGRGSVPDYASMKRRLS